MAGYVDNVKLCKLAVNYQILSDPPAKDATEPRLATSIATLMRRRCMWNSLVWGTDGEGEDIPLLG
jgi:hypothetical protein